MNKIPTLKLLVLCVGVGFAGCTEPNPRSCADDFCDDPAFPFCDVDGSIGGTPNTCVAVQCTPLAFEGCRGDEALFCSDNGVDLDVTQCEFGCDPLSGCMMCEPGTPGCDSRIVPLYASEACEARATESTLTVSRTTTLDTDNGQSCNGGVITQPGGPELCVVRYSRIDVERNVTLRVIGSRALALVADSALVIDGVLDVSADGPTNGPGGGTVASGTTPGAPSGGGGAGFRTEGGKGGSTTADGGVSNGGMAIDPAVLTSLMGGARAAFTSGFSDGQTGGGGGAAALIACRGDVVISGIVDAGGGGGAGGNLDFFSEDTPALGGGSGGHVVLQGVGVNVTGEVFANGGGGGAGQQNGNRAGANGADGGRSMTPAPGGIAQDNNGAGGAGGVEGIAPGNGKKPVNANIANAGAGGGSVGFFRCLVGRPDNAEITPSAASPAFSPCATVPIVQ